MSDDVGAHVCETHEGFMCRFVQVSYLFLYDPVLTDAQKILFMMLKRFAGDTQECFPGVSTLAKRMNVGERAVQKNMAALVERGLVRREIRPGRSNVYRLVPPEVFYTDENNRITPEVLARMEEVGETHFVKRVLASRGELVLSEKEQPRSQGEPDVVVEDPIPPRPQAQIPQRKLVSVDKLLGGAQEDKEPESDRGVSGATMSRIADTVARANAYKDRKEKRKGTAQKQKRDPVLPEDVNTVNLDGVKPLNTYDVHSVWVHAVATKFGKDCPAVNWIAGKDHRLVKLMIRRHGGKKIIDLVDDVISRWEFYSSQYGFKGFPSILILYKHASMWLNDLSQIGTPRKRALDVGEYNESSADEHRKQHPGGFALF